MYPHAAGAWASAVFFKKFWGKGDIPLDKVPISWYADKAALSGEKAGPQRPEQAEQAPSYKSETVMKELKQQ
jgi:hypothetical protein